MASANLTTCSRLLVNDKVWYVLGEWYKSHFNIRVSDGGQAWEGEVSADEVNKRANRWDWTPRRYIDAAVEHLREQQEEAKAAYQLTEKDAETLQLAWEMKQAGEEGVPLRGVVNLQKMDDPGGVVCAMMDYMHKKRLDLELELSKKTRAFRGMKEEAEKCANQARGFAEEKSRLESDLYKKFAAVLNSKKAKIRELKSQLADGKSQAIVPVGNETDDGEATDNEVSNAEGNSEEQNDERVDQAGPSKRSDGESDEDHRHGQKAESEDANEVAEVEEESERRGNGKGKGAEREEQNDGTGRGECRERSEALDVPGKPEEKDDAKPQANASALLGGGSTYTSGPRKRRR